MRTGAFGIALVAGLMVNVAPCDRGRAALHGGGSLAQAAEGPRGVGTAPKPAGRQKPPPRDRHAAGDPCSLRLSRAAAPSYAPSFSSYLYTPSIGDIAFVQNPIVSAQEKATPDYEYLYTPLSAYRAAPGVPSYKYVRDNRYLLSPRSSFRSGASAYAWKYSPLQRAVDGHYASPVLALLPNGEAYASDPAKGVSRGPGQKADTALKPSLLAAQGHKAQWQASPKLGEVAIAEDFRTAQGRVEPRGRRPMDDCR